MDKEIGINKTGGIGYISGLPSFTNTTEFKAKDSNKEDDEQKDKEKDEHNDKKENEK